MEHRSRVGGLWDEIGKLQFGFMVSQGLKPHHKLLDIGCGCLRGGVHFIKYLDEGNYYGVDKDADLLEFGMEEARAVGLGYKLFHLELDGKFEFDKLGVAFDFAIAQSLFTHLNLNEILLCLINLEKVIADSGTLYATFFNCLDEKLYTDTIRWSTDDRKIVSTQAAFSRSIHYTFDQLCWVADWAGLRAECVGEWGHPRKQEMAVFYK